MKFSAQEEYGLRCLMRVAETEHTCTIPDVARAEGLSESHVAKLLSILRKSGFVESTRGQTGGYSLCNPPSEILVGDVLEALGGKLVDDGFCGRHSGAEDSCVHSGDCRLIPLWARVQRSVDTALKGISLQKVIDESDALMPTIQLQDRRPSTKQGGRAT